MQLVTGSQKLHRSLKTLRQQWDETKSTWHDVVRDRFESGQLDEIEAATLGTLREIEKLSQVLTAALQECE